jgi:hypothetical protein
MSSGRIGMLKDLLELGFGEIRLGIEMIKDALKKK